MNYKNDLFGRLLCNTLREVGFGVYILPRNNETPLFVMLQFPL